MSPIIELGKCAGCIFYNFDTPGLNNYLEESLEHASGDNTEELDTRVWTCSLSADDPKLQSLLKEENSQVTWLTRDELGTLDLKSYFLLNKLNNCCN